MTISVTVRSSGAPTEVPAQPGSMMAAFGVTHTVLGPTDEVVIEADNEFGSRKDVRDFIAMASAMASGAFIETFMEDDSEPGVVGILDEASLFDEDGVADAGDFTPEQTERVQELINEALRHDRKNRGITIEPGAIVVTPPEPNPDDDDLGPLDF